MLPALHQACAETTGALWSSRMMNVRPFSRVARRTPGGMAGSDELVSGKTEELVLLIIGVVVERVRPCQHHLKPVQTCVDLGSGSRAGTSLTVGKKGCRKAWKKS